MYLLEKAGGGGKGGAGEAIAAESKVGLKTRLEGIKTEAMQATRNTLGSVQETVGKFSKGFRENVFKGKYAQSGGLQNLFDGVEGGIKNAAGKLSAERVFINDKKLGNIGVSTSSEISNSLNPKDVNFMQSSIKNITGEHTVLGNAEALRSETLKPSAFPDPMNVWRDTNGKIWTLDHRRLAAYKLSGLETVPVEWASPSKVADNLWKMSTKNGGSSIRLKLGNGQSITVK